VSKEISYVWRILATSVVLAFVLSSNSVYSVEVELNTMVAM
jgi:hypothetical protein